MKKKYKKSRFNYVSDTKNGIIIYNTLYNSLTRLSEEEYDVYLSEKYDNQVDFYLADPDRVCNILIDLFT